MCDQVALQIRLLGKRFAAVLTFIGLLAGMKALVNAQVSLMAEGGTTLWARMRFIPGVKEHVVA